MKDGYYQVEFYGRFGSGAASFALRDGEIVGTDVGGGQYGGKVTFDPSTGKSLLKMTLRAPAGVFLVTDGRVRSKDELMPIELELTENDLGTPLSMKTPTGPVTVTIRYCGEILGESVA